MMTFMTIEQFRQIHDEWKISGLSIQQFCENIGITESRFFYQVKLKSESLPSSWGSFILAKQSDRFSLYLLRNDTDTASDLMTWRTQQNTPMTANRLYLLTREGTDSICTTSKRLT